jgi:hypothetical protein
MAPTILRTRKLKVRLYPRDHNPPHVHVVGPDAEAKFELTGMKCVFSRGFSASALKQIREFLNKEVFTGGVG